MDETRKQAVLSFAGTPARLVGTIGGGARVAARVRDLAVVALAAEQVGGAARCTEMAVEYAKTRVQFDRPIGTFQAVKHKCADMLIATETARSALFQAVRDAAAGNADLPISAATAKVIASQAYVSVAGENIHVHGGIGFTWEHQRTSTTSGRRAARYYWARGRASTPLRAALRVRTVSGPGSTRRQSRPSRREDLAARPSGGMSREAALASAPSSRRTTRCAARTSPAMIASTSSTFFRCSQARSSSVGGTPW